MYLDSQLEYKCESELQVFYYGKVWEKAMTMSNWSDFFAAFFKGPGWFPGTERLGDITFVPERPVRQNCKKFEKL